MGNALETADKSSVLVIVDLEARFELLFSENNNGRVMVTIFGAVSFANKSVSVSLDTSIVSFDVMSSSGVKSVSSSAVLLLLIK